MTKIIAEFCQNHNGDFELVKRMLAAAAEGGATHVKIQNIFADNLTFRPQFEEGFTSDGNVLCIKRPFQDEYKRLKSLEISLERCAEFIDLSRSYNLVPLTTCFSRDTVRSIKSIGFEEVKVASYDCASFQLLKDLRGKFTHIYVSTGATFDGEIEHAAKILEDEEHTLLHCVTIYPTPLSSMNLMRLNYLSTLSKNVGFSDHSSYAKHGVLSAKAAIYLGASVVERHFTILESSMTKDGPVSIDQKGLNEISTFAKLSKHDMLQNLLDHDPMWEIMIGSQTRNLSHSELLNRDYYRGRFASQRSNDINHSTMIYNWEETPLLER